MNSEDNVKEVEKVASLQVSPPTPSHDAPSFAALAALAVGVVVFSNFVHEVATWSVCLTGHVLKGGCSDIAKRDANMLGTMISAFVAVMGASYAGRWGGKTPRAAALLTIAAIAAAFFSLLKAAVGPSGFPQPDKLVIPALVFCGCVAVLLAPYLLVRLSWLSDTDALALPQRISLALFVGAFLGGLDQLAAEIFWQMPGDGGSVSKLVVAPSAAVAGGAMIGIVILDPWLRLHQRRASWATGWAAFAVFLASAHMTIYASDHDWIVGLPAALRVAGLGVLVLASGVLAATLACLAAPKHVRAALWLAAIVAALLAGVAAYGLGLERLASGKMITVDLPTFVAVHGISPLLCIPAIVVADMLAHKIDRPGWA